MALIKSNILSSIRGSMAGTTFSQNRNGAYIRNRTVPVNPNTDRQQFARGVMGYLSQYWSNTLTGDQRATWINYAANTPTTNRLGDTIHLTGMNWFVAINAFKLNVGATLVTVSPETPGVADTLTSVAWGWVIASQSSTTDANTLTVSNFLNGDTDATARYAYWISNPVSAGTLFYKGPWNYLGSKLGTTRGAAVPIPFDVTEGQLFYVKMRYMDRNYKLSGDTIFGYANATTET